MFKYQVKGLCKFRGEEYESFEDTDIWNDDLQGFEEECVTLYRDPTYEQKSDFAQNYEADGTSELSQYIWADYGLSMITKIIPTFEYDSRTGDVHVVCKVESDSQLTITQLSKLKDFCQGQWSDGWGESFEQLLQDNEFYVSPWFPGQEIEVTLLVS